MSGMFGNANENSTQIDSIHSYSGQSVTNTNSSNYSRGVTVETSENEDEIDYTTYDNNSTKSNSCSSS